jgi:hypothetical protein
MLVGMMKKTVTEELRTAQRFHLQDPIRLRGSTLPVIVGATGKSHVVDGHVQNISSGGLCLLVQKSLKISELLVGEIAVPGTRASIPTLLQVKWLSKNSFGPRYRAGLHYVLEAGMIQALQASTEVAGPTPTGKGVSRKSPKRK